MLTCKKCGKKAKTSYERVFGEKPTFEPVGFYCHRCGIFYDAATKLASKVVYGVAKKDDGGVRLEVAADQERIRLLHKPSTFSTKNVYESNQNDLVVSSSRNARESGWGEIRTLDHLRVRQVS